MFRVDNLQAGDMIIWKGEGRTMGIVIDTNPDPHDEQAVLIEFYDGDGINPLHYYYHELDDFLENGEIRIQHG
jgi:hypothetical protein